MKTFAMILERMIKPEFLDIYKKTFGDLVHETIKAYGKNITNDHVTRIFQSQILKRYLSFLGDSKYFQEGHCNYLIDDPIIKTSLMGLSITIKDVEGYILTGNKSLSFNPLIDKLKITKDLLGITKLTLLIQTAFEVSNDGVEIQCSSCKFPYPYEIFSMVLENTIGDLTGLTCCHCDSQLIVLNSVETSEERSGFEHSELKSYLGRSEEVCNLEDLLI